MKKTIVNPVIKDTVTFVQTSESSNGNVTEMELSLSPNGSTPMHYHKSYSETFTAIEGNVGLKLKGGITKILKSGEAYTIEKMKVHSFFNPTEDNIKFNVQLNPGHQGFEYSLRILYGLASDGLTNKKSIPKKIKHTAIIACMGDQNLPGIFTLIFPLLKRIANKAKASGEEQELIDKYCV